MNPANSVKRIETEQLLLLHKNAKIEFKNSRNLFYSSSKATISQKVLSCARPSNSDMLLNSITNCLFWNSFSYFMHFLLRQSYKPSVIFPSYRLYI